MTDRSVSPADARIADYIRSRSDVDVPPSLTTEVMRFVADAPQARTSWFGAFGTPLAAVSAVALIVIAAVLFTAPRQVGPVPEPTPTPAPTLTATEALNLTKPGDVVRIAAMDSQGQYGTITIERGDEVGAYEGNDTPMFWDSYFVEVHMSY